MTLHKCEPGTNWDTEEYYFESGFFGQAICTCEESEDGKLWCDNEEYKTRVNFCPFCGYEAKNKVEWTMTNETD